MISLAVAWVMVTALKHEHVKEINGGIFIITGFFDLAIFVCVANSIFN